MDPFKTVVLGKLPPESEELRFVFPIAPVSHQANSVKKDAVRAAIRAVTRTAEYLFTDDVQVEIKWTIQERDRYERDSSADVDNIVKPILDALSGPDGIIVNDCQVQSVSCYWVHWERPDEQIEILVRLFPPGSSLLKRDMYFVHFGKGLCWPFGDVLGPEYDSEVLELLDRVLQIREEIVQRTGKASASRYLMPAQRFFHRSRVSDFRVVEADAIRKPKSVKLPVA